MKKKKLNFTHLHLHTTFSLLDGAIRIKDLMEYLNQHEMDSVAITDHGNMYGVIQFYQEAVKHNIKPIIGNEFYVAPGKRTEKKFVENLADGNNFHLVLLAQNLKGYKNLIKLTSRSFTEGFYRKPRIDYELLEEYSEGLICLTACLGGEVQSKILSGRFHEAEALAKRLKDIFGKDRFYLEIQNHGLKEEEIVAKGNIEISKKWDIPLVLTNDAHFLTQKDHEIQDILLRINQKKTIDEPLEFGFNQEFYVKTPEEMFQVFPEIPEAFYNTQKIKEMVDLSFEFGNPLLPKFDVPKGYTTNSYLRKLAEEGLKRRYKVITKEIQERFEFEYKVITEMDFASYFLIVQDFINWAKSQNIPVGPGRGSAAGSLIAYCLGITEIDPIRYNLLFERFLNLERKEMPDIDVDFCMERREEVINYVKQKYGEENVAQIITYGNMAAKACIKDVARVLKMPFAEANLYSQAIPNTPKITIEEAYEESLEFQRYVNKSELHKKVFEIAKKLEGNSRQTGVHAAGVVIAPEPLENIVPLATVANPKDKSSQRILVTQFDMNVLSEIGLVKMDFLGLRNLTVIHNTLKRIQKRRGIQIDINNIPLDDKKTYQLLQSGKVKGIFQLESSPGMRDFVVRMQPEVFEDLIALIAMYRPGPLQTGMADMYINRKKGLEKVEYPHPDLEGILKETYGVILYQEQVMQIAQKIGGFSKGQSDTLRKAMGKKIESKMQEMKVLFIEGAVQRGYDSKFAEELYNQMSEFAKYGFNKSHSAAYAMIVYQTAYLKANYTIEFLTEVLNSEIHKTEKLTPYFYESKELNIKIEKPDINKSFELFEIENENTIRYGLSAIKNVGDNVVSNILEVRNRIKQFRSFTEFLQEINLKTINKRALESLIYAGCFDNLGYTRKGLIESLEYLIEKVKKNKEPYQESQGVLFLSLGTTNLLMKHGFYHNNTEALEYKISKEEFQQDEFFKKEKEVLGIYFSGHPLDKYQYLIRHLKITPIEKLYTENKTSEFELCGVIQDLEIKSSRNKKEYARFQLLDWTGQVQCLVFSNLIESNRNLLQEDQIVWVKGRADVDEETQNITILVDEIKALTEELLEEKAEQSLHIKIQREVFQEDSFVQLWELFNKHIKNHKGKAQIYFHIIENGSTQTVIKAHSTFSISVNDELIKELKKIEGIKGIYHTIGTTIKAL
ncbi:MAG: DNA polymerase III subunit alpha [Leptospiraceae bacterium]|nr:DNA polymerase III subunit alpha [Leptospiraceae bacterium]MDW7976470.1 DNA polymerase III subunit alpha [Leptospiraceae bacterium]